MQYEAHEMLLGEIRSVVKPQARMMRKILLCRSWCAEIGSLQSGTGIDLQELGVGGRGVIVPLIA